MTLAGKTALITGAMTGIGYGIAEGFADAGLNLVMNGIREAALVEPQRAAIEARGVRAMFYQADVSNADAVEAMLAAAAEEFGGVDIVVNNAGIQHVAPLEEFPREKWDAIIAVNLSAAFNVCRAAIPLMKQRGWGRIINIASAHGLVASPFKSAYVASKHGVIGLTKTLGIELGEDNITCNAICPGYVLTPLVQEQIAATAKARGITEEEVVKDVMLEAQWTKKFVTAEQLAATALFLASEAAENITGAAIPVDGGWTAA
ncbi:MAG: 3-hydroxybutyrate dehydrogenase [Pseudomonadota bacterium]